MSVAAKNNFQDYDPRHRLTGAVVLILLAIVLLPMLLSKKPDAEVPEADPVVMEITKTGKKVFVSRISSTTAKDTTEAQKQVRGSDAKGSDKKEVVKKESDKKDTDKQSSALFKPMATTAGKKATPPKSTTKTPVNKSTTKKTASSKQTEKKSPATVPAGDWVLQVGVFSQSANASKKVSELKKKGFPAKSGKVKTSKGTVTKVWIGPFKDRKSAEKVQDRLQHKTRERGIVVKNKS